VGGLFHLFSPLFAPAVQEIVGAEEEGEPHTGVFLCEAEEAVNTPADKTTPLIAFGRIAHALVGFLSVS